MTNNPGEGPGSEHPQRDPTPFEHSPLSARIPSHASHWIFSTEVIVLTMPTEFVLDFLTRLGKPHTVSARVVMSPPVFGQFIAALRENLGMYTSRLGPPATLPVPSMPAQQHAPQHAQSGQSGGAAAHATHHEARPSINDIYDELKLPDEMLSGVYANAVMIGHSMTEFWFDFITNFFPRPAVSCRVCMAAQHVPGLVHTLTNVFEAAQRRPPNEPPEESGQ